jgi:VanZ family protein
VLRVLHEMPMLGPCTVRGIVCALAWFGVFAILVFSVIPANERHVTGIGQGLEHFTAFGLVAGAFAAGYRLRLIQFLLIALLFCGAIELLQVPLPTRRARVSDFFIDFLGSCLALFLVTLGHKIISHLSLGRHKPVISAYLTGRRCSPIPPNRSWHVEQTAWVSMLGHV